MNDERQEKAKETYEALVSGEISTGDVDDLIEIELENGDYHAVSALAAGLADYIDDHS